MRVQLQQRITALETDLEKAKRDHAQALQALDKNIDLVSHLQARVQDTVGRSAALGTCVDCEAGRVAGLLAQVDGTIGRLSCGEKPAWQIDHQALRLCAHCSGQVRASRLTCWQWDSWWRFWWYGLAWCVIAQTHNNVLEILHLQGNHIHDPLSSVFKYSSSTQWR